MKKTVPFKKDLAFKTNIAEIVSISLDHELKLETSVIKGNLIISGSYKMNDVSINTEEFKYEIPVNIEMSDKYILDDLDVTIEDFYYEIIDNKILGVNVEVGLNNLLEKVELEPVKFEEAVLEETRDVKDLFENLDDSVETYTTYEIHIVKEGDTLESILIKYSINKESLEQYNDISEIKIGDKIIIPALLNERD